MPTGPGPTPSAPPTQCEKPGPRDGALFTQRGKLHPICALLAMALAPPSANGAVAGVILLAAWLTLRVWAVRHIGGAARVRAPKARERKRLVTSGPFALVRNPLYLANIMGLAGTSLVLAPVWYGALAALAALAWYGAIVRWEEGVLTELYGAEYTEYRSRTPALIPSPRRVLQGGYGPAALPLAKALRRERGLAVIVAVVSVLALVKRML